MTIATYADLQTKISDQLNRGDITTTAIKDFITLGECDINRISRLRDQETTSTITMVSGQAYNSLPSDFLDLVDGEDFLYTDTLEKISIVSKAKLAQLKTSASTRPTACYIGARIDYDSAPDSAYTLTLPYIKKWDIATNSTTTQLLIGNPGAYLYTALAHASPYLMKDDRIVMWKAMAQQILDELHDLSSRPKGKAPLTVDNALMARRAYNIYTDQ